MEKRALLAIALSVAILVGWQFLFAPPPPSGPAPSAPDTPAAGGAGQAGPPVAPSAAPAPAGGELVRAGLPRAAVAARASEVSTPLYHGTFGADGSVRAWVLRYRGVKELLVDEQLGALSVTLTRPGRAAEVVPLSPAEARLELGPGRPSGALTFHGRTTDGLRVDRVLRFRADSYGVEVDLRLAGEPAGDGLTVALSWTSPVVLMAGSGAVQRVGDQELVLETGEGKDRRQWTVGLTPETGVLRDGRQISAREITLDDGATVMYRQLEGRSVAKSIAVKAGKKPPRDAAPLTFGEVPDHHGQLLGRILVARNGRPESIEPPAAALRDPKETPGGPELKEPQPLPLSVLGAGPRWIALENDYFIAALIPATGGRVLRARTREWTEVGLVFSDVQLKRGEPWEGRASLYVGPKEWNRLAAVGVGLEEAQARNYGCFPFPCDYLALIPMEWFCVPLLWLMNVFATRIPGQNYGVAIILLTVLVKIVFYPLTHKSMSSMKAMQALQPQLNALRAKYKSDRQRFQREQMELFRKHKVNPMGGCLPMIVQIPIFYALYLTLQYSVELQGAPFVLWITDLSKKDPFYVLPILMGVSMLVQQKMTPTVGDPRQANIMLIMPVIFTFMFLEFPTGLVLYWFVNNVLSIAQQYAIDRAILRKKAAPAIADKPGREPRKA